MAEMGRERDAFLSVDEPHSGSVQGEGEGSISLSLRQCETTRGATKSQPNAKKMQGLARAPSRTHDEMRWVAVSKELQRNSAIREPQDCQGTGRNNLGSLRKSACSSSLTLQAGDAGLLKESPTTLPKSKTVPILPSNAEKRLLSLDFDF
ncbi:hypothetical protein CONLIGDRAFT_262904 [Coniochaeta ligniaria NRRL 30616]|uniref:Uncharacterized protein n=1 Tax=Coniochaeta ligniaria NRRL 30616 TaxID=1408157 RepID=A0A1J7IXM2_9PEZI|nr:hypothetical protein CONLIGDRAFT_262904 [Coniochaeta ligniaria NRRL 30616]